jgi:hypothetical protein
MGIGTGVVTGAGWDVVAEADVDAFCGLPEKVPASKRENPPATRASTTAPAMSMLGVR